MGTGYWTRSSRHAPGAVVKGGDAVGVGSGAAGDAAGAIVEANVLAWAGASVASVVKSAMVMIRMINRFSATAPCPNLLPPRASPLAPPGS